MELVKGNSSNLEEFKRLVGRVIVETNENRKVNEEEAKRIRLYLQRLWNLFIREGRLDWDPTADLFTNTLEDTVIEREGTDETDETQTENNEFENIQLRREMAGAIKESININAFWKG